MAENTTKRNHRGGAFALELEGEIAGYLKKVDMPKMTGNVATNDGGPISIQSKQVTNMEWGPVSFDIGLGMSPKMFSWINATYKHNYQIKDCAILMMNENYEVVRRCDITHAHMTEATIAALDAKGKEGLYMSCKLQPEMVRYTNGGGKATSKLAQSQKLYAATMFEAHVPGLPCDNISKIDALKFEVKVTADPVGKFIEQRYCATKSTFPDVKFTVNDQDVGPWYDKFFAYIQAGKRKVTDELAIGIDIKGPDAAETIATIELKGCGPKEFSHGTRTANEDKNATFEATFFVEEIDFLYHASM